MIDRIPTGRSMVIATMFLAGAPAQAASDPPAQDAALITAAQTSLRSLVDRLGALQACALRADVEAVFHETFGAGGGVAIDTPIAGSFEFAASGDAWRKRSFMDPALYRGMNTEIAFNGELYEYAMRDNGVMTISRTGDDKAPGMTLPNPIIALGQFLIPENETSNDITLASLGAACAAFDVRSAAWRVEQTPEGPRAVAEFAGGEYLSEPYVYRAHIPASADQPLTIERVLQSGRTLVRTTFSDWRDVPGPGGVAQPWPMAVRFEGFDPATGAPAADMRMTVTNLALSKGAPGGAADFLLDWDAARRIWLDEPGAFVK